MKHPLVLRSSSTDGYSDKLLAYCKSKNIHCTAYSCLGGAVDNPLYKEPVLIETAKVLGKPPAQVL